MLPTLKTETFAFQPFLELRGTRKNANSFALSETVACFGADNSVFIEATLFNYRSCGNPKLIDLDSTLALICLRMVKKKEFGRLANMVVVQMSESNHIVVFTRGLFQILPQLVRQSDSEIIWIIRATDVRKIDKNLFSIFEINPTTVGVSQREEREFVHTAGLLLPIRLGITFVNPAQPLICCWTCRLNSLGCAIVPNFSNVPPVPRRMTPP